jgi:death-on-curing protein
MSEIILPNREIILKIHNDQINIFGGATGVRDVGGIDAAIERPRNMLEYGDGSDVFDAAAAITFSITRIRHPFTDGNKRVGAELCHIILRVNGWELDCTNAEFRDKILDVASGIIEEKQFASWCRLISLRL